ncbi:MAG: glycoside hydrolase 43 family protein [Opitutaceae bacterium]|nr:glycoside hydrolase 43 family protein [Opitutaceae bacterium]
MAHPHRFPWTPDSGNGEYRNPVIHADYSDPDVIRHGDDFYLVASSFCCTPGLPILHSRDLVNWTIVNHALRRLPHARYTEVQPGCGVWAPAIRHHAGRFWIFFPMPDEGIFVTTAEDPRDEWSDPWCLIEAKGWIDPCPFWDDDGRAWIVHAYAKSRTGIRNRIVLHEMLPDASRLVGEGRVIIHAEHQDVLEGPKLHKIDGLYYILAPGGGVTDGWQLAYRSASLQGPYAEHLVLERGSTGINGPHQGALVDLDDGEWWFIHFQDAGPFGRVTHLQPVRWINGWPEMGVDHDGNGVGEPVARWKKPSLPAAGQVATPQTTDEFDQSSLGRQWQWQANHEPGWASLDARPGWLRLASRPRADLRLPLAQHLLGQKFPAREFDCVTLVDINECRTGEVACLAVAGGGHGAAIGLRRGADGAHELVFIHDGTLHSVAASHDAVVRLRVRVAADGCCTFAWSCGPGGFEDLPVVFRSEEHGWMGARIGLVALALDPDAALRGSADFDYLRFS